MSSLTAPFPPKKRAFKAPADGSSAALAGGGASARAPSPLEEELGAIRARLQQNRLRVQRLLARAPPGPDALSYYEAGKAPPPAVAREEVAYLAQAPRLPQPHIPGPLPHLKRLLAEAVEGFLARRAQAREATAKAHESRVAAQRALESVRGLNAAFQRLILRALVHQREKEVRAPVKSEAERLAEAERDRMVGEIVEQMARDLAEEESAPAAPLPRARPRWWDRVLDLFIERGLPGQAQEAVLVRLRDVHGSPLPATRAHFFVDGKPVKPLWVRREHARLPPLGEQSALYVRVLGYVDTPARVEGGQAEAVLPEDLLVVVTDEEGKPLNQAFVTLADDQGNKVEDVYGNFVWRTPHPPQARTGCAHIALNPLGLSFSALVLRAVKAYHQETTLLVPTNLITSERVLEQKIQLAPLRLPSPIAENEAPRVEAR